MARRHEAARLLKGGYTLPDIARHLGRDTEDVIQYLRLQVGEGQVKLSELFFAIPAQRRHYLESLIRDTGATTAAGLQKAAPRPLTVVRDRSLLSASEPQDLPRRFL